MGTVEVVLGGETDPFGTSCEKLGSVPLDAGKGTVGGSLEPVDLLGLSNRSPASGQADGKRTMLAHRSAQLSFAKT